MLFFQDEVICSKVAITKKTNVRVPIKDKYLVGNIFNLASDTAKIIDEINWTAWIINIMYLEFKYRLSIC